ncbi:MAG: hypothetical protein KRP56_04700 [Candidatus Methanogranum gryphiswaldense]|nr:MAG: hypothetical protein KRP56_04700 [Candidatus Methanogranum sp. U3.2.1]
MHCKDVSLRDVTVPLTIEGITDLMVGWKAYKRTEYLVLRNGKDIAVIMIEKVGNKELFQNLSAYEIVSLPVDTVYHEDPGLDVLNAPALARVQVLYPGKTVVVCGMFSHINFIKDIEPLKLRVIDNVPPSPSKLGVLVDIALASGFVDHPIVTEKIDIDMADRVKDVDTEAVMFPCRVSNLKAEIPFYFLDEAPTLKHEVTLIGCNLSDRIFESLYGTHPKFINVCPMDNVPLDGIRTIVKCCKVKEGHTRNGNLVIVPWGATVPEVVDAINDLFSE